MARVWTVRSTVVTDRTGRVAVIGAAGFIGGHAVPALTRAGRDVASFTRSAPFLGDAGLHPDIEAAQTIFWLASSINPQIAAEHPERVAADQQVFVDFLERLGASGATPTVVLLSSGGTVYDPKSTPPYREDSPTGPISAYGAAKVELEEILAQLAPAAHVTVRVANAYGPGQQAKSGQGVIAYWMAAALRDEPITIIGDPASARDYVFAADIADALVAIDAVEKPSDLPSILNVGSGQATSLQQLSDLLTDVVTPHQLKIERQPARSFDIDRTWLSIECAKTTIAWAPQTSLHQGLLRTWQHVVSLSRGT